MSVDIVKVAQEKWRIVLYTLFCVVFALGLVNYSKEIGLRVFDFMAENQHRNLSTYIEKEKSYIYSDILELSKNQELRKSVKGKDVVAIKSILDNEVGKTGIPAFTVSDENGMALTRLPIGSSLGDNIFLTIPIGRMVANGTNGVIFTPARNFPLTLAGGYLMKGDNDSNLGAIFGGYWLDNKYAKYFKSKYLNDIRNREIIFYSKEDGVVGNSIEDLDTRNKIRTYVNHASTLIQEGRSGDLLNIKGTDYVITNHILSGPEDIYGGMLLLTPIPGTLLIRSFVVSLLITILFFISLLILEKISIPELLRFRKKSLYLLLYILSGLVFFSLWSGIYAHGKDSTIDINKPKLTIYNSTMKLKPGSGVYTVGYPQQIAIHIYSGGESINAAQVNLRFNPDVMNVDSLSFDRSICTPETILEKIIDNKKGVISISCAIVDTAFDDSYGIVADINFTPKESGDLALTFSEDNHVLASDGLGTDVLRSVTSGYYRIFNEEEISSFFSKNTFVIPYSITHENSSKWYSNKNISLVWPKTNASSYLYELSQNASSTFVNPKTTKLNSVNLTVPKDGVYYFRLAAEKGDIQGLVSTLKIHIDDTPPDTPTITASNLSIKKNDVVRFRLSSEDRGSGLQKNFYVKVDSSTWLPSFSKLYMPFREVGTHEFSVRVFDNAENYSDSSVIINVRN